MLTFGPKANALANALDRCISKVDSIHADVNALATDVGELSSKQALIRVAVSALQGAVNAIGADVTRVTNGVNALATFSENDLATKTDVGGLSSIQGAVEAIGADVTRVMNGVSALFTTFVLGGLATDVNALATDVNALKATVNALPMNPVLTEVKFQEIKGKKNTWKYLALRGSNGVVHELREHLSGNELPLTLYLDSAFTWTIVADGDYPEKSHSLRIDNEPSTLSTNNVTTYVLPDSLRHPNGGFLWKLGWGE